MISPITLDALRTLDAIERRGSFAGAAQELFRVPSAVSYTVQKLEEELDVMLFDRSRRRAQLTPAGRLVLEQGRQILRATDELTALARQSAEGWEAELCIALDTVLTPEPLLHLIQRFRAVQPHCEVRIVEEVLGGCWDALESGRCDLAIGVHGDPPGSGFSYKPLGEAVFSFAVAADHPLCLLDEPIPLTALRDYPTVVVADSSRYLPVRSSGLLDGQGRLVVASTAQKIAAQIQGLGIGYLPLHRIQHELASGQLCELTLAEVRSPQLLSIAWRRDKGRGRGVRWFVEQLKQLRLDPERGLVQR